MNKFKPNYDKMVDDQYGLTNAINATMEFANGKFNKNYKMIDDQYTMNFEAVAHE